MSAVRGRWNLRYGLAVAGVALVALGLRLWGIRSGLPWVYNVDEAQHFVPTAIGMLGGNLNPGYATNANPPAFTYLLAVLFKLVLGGRAARLYHSNHSSEVWILARVASGVLGTLAVWLLYLAGARLFNRRTGLLAAAILAVAFLPVAYGKLALNDSPTLAPVCLSLLGSAGILRLGRRRDFALAAVGLGLAAATKYTGGIVVAPLLVAAIAAALRPGAGRATALWIALSGVFALAAFIAANPYSVVAFHAFIEQIVHQSAQSGSDGKLGLTYGSGVLYYLWTLTWGLGWVPALAAFAGAVALAWRRRWTVFLMLVPAVIAFLAFMGLQGRYFGRWVMPIIPVLCLLGAYAAVGAAGLAARRLPRLGPGLVALAAAALCAQGLIAGIHSGVVNSRLDTRTTVRRWLLAHVPRATRMVIEPIVVNSRRPPHDWAAYWRAFPDFYTHIGRGGRLLVRAGAVVGLENYERTLAPALIGLYERTGYCWVVTGSTEEGRALADPAAVPLAIAYYAALAAHATVAFRVSPYAPAVAAVPFNFDWSFDYYPSAYRRPGPTVTVYRLHGGRCAGG